MALSPKDLILIRVEANETIGFGHFMRMLAMGQALSKLGFVIQFYMTNCNHQLSNLLDQHGFSLFEAKTSATSTNSSNDDLFLAFCRLKNPICVVLDGESFSQNLEKNLRQLEFKTIRILDLPDSKSHADLIINPNFGAENFHYLHNSESKLALGIKFGLLRDEFQKNLRPRSVAPPTKKQILVSLGASQLQTSYLYDLFENFAKANSELFSFQILRGVKLERISEIMLVSDFAFIAAGVTMWESMKLGLPFHAIALTSDQISYLELMKSHNLWFGHTKHNELDHDLILKIVNSYFSRSDLAVEFLSRYNSLEIGSETQQLLSEFLIR